MFLRNGSASPRPIFCHSLPLRTNTWNEIRCGIGLEVLYQFEQRFFTLPAYDVVDARSLQGLIGRQGRMMGLAGFHSLTARAISTFSRIMRPMASDSQWTH
jgi:hypothetical protein